MFIEVRLYATLRRYVPSAVRGVFSLEVIQECSVSELLQTIAVDLEEVHIIMINGVASTLESILHDGDRLGVFPAVGGG